MLGPDAARCLALDLRRLSPLARWPPVAALAERLCDGLQGIEGISTQDLSRLNRWANRWARLHPDVRRFYVDALVEAQAEDRKMGLLSTGLYSVLDRSPAPGWCSGALNRWFSDLYGIEPDQHLTT